MNIASLWIVVIFSVIAITLVALFGLIHHSIQQEELHYTLREQVSVLSDHADQQVLSTMENQVLRRLATLDASSQYITAFSQGVSPDTENIRTLMRYCTELTAAIDQADRIEIYFPAQSLIIGSQGVRFLADKKYTVQESGYSYLRSLDTAKTTWMRQEIMIEGTATPFILCIRPYAGVFPQGTQPLLLVYSKEENFHASLRQALRTLESSDAILLTRADGSVFSSSLPELVGTTLPPLESPYEVARLANGQEVLYAEKSSGIGDWYYVLAHPGADRFTGYDTIFSIWGGICIALILAGLILVLRVMIKHYSAPMQRLLSNLSIPETGKGKNRLPSPIDHFLQIETALSDMSKMQKEQEAFLAENKPLLRNTWLDCFIHGEASYLGPQPQLDLCFPYPCFQIAVTSENTTPDENALILSAFDPQQWMVAVFETRQKETVFLFNHAFDETALPRMLESLMPRLDQLGSQLAFGVGILAATDELVPPSFRCARRALSAHYFEKNQRVAVYDPKKNPSDSGDTLPMVINQLNELTGLIRHQSEKEVQQTIDSIVNQLKESNPNPNMMRSIALLAAAFFSKVVYDMRGVPETVYGGKLMDIYYHIDGISEFSLRLKEDSELLGKFLAQENSVGNRSVVQYAIHHIRNAPPSELSIQSIADALSISTGHLSRMFHQETGRKLVDYLQEVRMEHAARLLQEGVMTNEEICERIGYSRLQYFSSKFKEHYGLTLNEYRRKCQFEQTGKE